MFGVGLFVGLLAAYLLLLKTTKAQAPTIEHEEQIIDAPLTPNLAVAEELYQEWLKERKAKNLAPKGQFNACSCVIAAKAWTGFNKSIGYAKNWPINSQFPVVGGVVVTNEGGYPGHVAYILQVVDGRMYVRDGNFARCRVTERWIDIKNPVIRGYWTP